MANVYEWLSAYGTGCTREDFLVVPASAWGPADPVVIGTGTVNAPVQDRRILEVMAKARMNDVIIAHTQPSGEKRPSFGDIREFVRERSMLESCGKRLVDWVIVNTYGEIFSFRREGIFEDIEKGMHIAGAAELAARTT